jgi:hypothetical protein
MGIFNFGKKKDAQRHEEKAEALENAGLAGAATEIVQRYGNANAEHLVAYGGGLNPETGKPFAKSIAEESRRYYQEAEKIKQTVTDPKEAENSLHKSLKSHAGYAAELDDVAIENSDKIIAKYPTRRIRMDDLTTEKGGKVNHDLYDHVDLDKNGNPIKGTESQMKMKGDTPDEALSKLMEKGKLKDDGTYKNEKYIDHDVKMKVQKDFADDIKTEEIPKRIKSLEEQAKALEGIPEKEQDLQKIKRQIKKLETLEKNVEASNVTNQGSIDNILHPKFETAKKITKISHQAGVEAVKTGIVISSGVSLIKNIVAVTKGEKDANEAAMAVVKDTGTGAVVSYATGFTGSTIKSVMESSGKVIKDQKGEIIEFIPNKTLHGLSKTNLPGMIVTATLETGKTLGKYFKGEIDGAECLEELGEKGTGMVASAMFATIGQIAIPIPVVGGMIGSMLGYALSSACYNELVGSLKEAKLAREERIRIEAECEEAIKAIRQYREEMEKMISIYLVSNIETFHSAFDGIKDALRLGDIDGFIANTNTITKKLGGNPQFETFSDFDALMGSSASFKL